MAFRIALIAPEIPPNTGNIARLSVAAGAELHLVKPLGFSLDDRHMRRAGLDYWNDVRVVVHESLDEFLAIVDDHTWFLTAHAGKPYTTIPFTGDELLVFGAETAGFPESLRQRFSDRMRTIPMFGPARCLNLSNAVAVVVYEGLRQTKGF